MTLTVLVSFSLLALVVTARPIVPQDPSTFQEPSLDVRNAVQALFHSHAGSDNLSPDDERDVRIHLTSAEEQNVYLSNLDGLDAVKAIVPLGDVLSDDEQRLYDALAKAKVDGASSLDDLEGGERPLPDDELLAQPEHRPEPEPEQEAVESAADVPPAHTRSLVLPPLLVLTVSCLAAFATLLCVGVFLYAVHFVRSQLFESEALWRLLPHAESQLLSARDNDDDGEGSEEEKQGLLSFQEILTDEPTDRISAEDAAGEKQPSAEVLQSIIRDVLAHDEEFGEKFEDAEETPLVALLAQPLQPQQLPVFVHPDPDFLPLPALPTPFLTPAHTPAATPSSSPLYKPIHMREMPSVGPVSVSKPAWSVRAADAPSFAFLDTSSLPPPPAPPRASSPQLPGTLPLDSPTEQGMVERPSVRRAYRVPVPELDIAFALQLRPGLGLGADSAWLVRFLMAMFGWMSVIFGGAGGYRRERVQRAIM